MSEQKIRVFIQARMSSRRFPGKVLAPLAGKPLVYHLIHSLNRVLPWKNITVLTSNLNSDDPLVTYLKNLGISVFRGDLDNVFSRFQSCLEQFPCDYFLRSCGDSPKLSPDLTRAMVELALKANADLVTNVYPRTFPKGQSVEILKAQSFTKIDVQALNAEEQEHITRFYYQNPQNFKIVNVSSQNPEWANLSMAVDTMEDLHRLKEQSFSELLKSIAIAAQNQC
ncbi:MULTISPECIES: NTP transferase domain-containing protein [Spirulina sp. CCY15215]|uniref:cytidylyltransferase domain-containing protein n=1 Tax=Spirulina sp. CCY15215 TaxID=2767591 RepID=UPI0019500D42